MLPSVAGQLGWRDDYGFYFQYTFFFLPAPLHKYLSRKNVQIATPLTTNHAAHIHLFNLRPSRFASSFSNINFSTPFRFWTETYRTTLFPPNCTLQNVSPLAPCSFNLQPSKPISRICCDSVLGPMLCMRFASLAWCRPALGACLSPVSDCLLSTGLPSRCQCYTSLLAQRNHATSFLVHDAPAIGFIRVLLSITQPGT